MLKTLLLTSLSAAVALGQSTPASLTAALAGNPDLSQLTALIGGQPELADALSKASNITVLAPSNNAISALLNSTAGKTAAADPATVAAILSYHVLKGTYYASQIKGSLAFVPTLLTNTAYANVTGGQRVGAVAADGSVTFFSGLLQNSTVVAANQNFTGGTIHVIDSVLTLPASISTTLVTAGLSSLYGALNATNLLDAVNGLKDVTIFAPANAAFSAIGSALPSLNTTVLSSILTYHVVNGTRPIYSSDLTDGATVGTLQGGKLTVRIRGSNVFVNGAKVITPNVLVAGGVVHVIDHVLNPGNASATVPDNSSAGAPAFSGASSASGAPFTSGVPTATGTAGNVVSQSGAAAPMRTAAGVVGAGALFGAVWVNL